MRPALLDKESSRISEALAVGRGLNRRRHWEEDSHGRRSQAKTQTFDSTWVLIGENDLTVKNKKTLTRN